MDPQGLRTTEQVVAFLRELRANGRIAIADSHLSAIRNMGMTRHDVETQRPEKLEEQLAAKGVPRGVAEDVVHHLRLALLGQEVVYETSYEAPVMR
jgi:hypothetical protein